MSFPISEERTYRALYESPILSVHDYCCHSAQSGPAAEEESALNTIVLMRHGTFARHFGSRTIAADVNQAVFFSANSTYRVSHPADCGDRGTIFSISSRVLNDIVREIDPTVDEHPDNPFRFVTGPCASEIFLRHRELVQRLDSGEALEPIWADVTALQLVADVLESAFARQGIEKKARRRTTVADRVERAEAAKSYLAANFTRRLTLDDVARAVNVSPFHLARIFQEHTDVPVHRYLTQLRLRVALERLNEGVEDLTSLALDLGFSSHSHFTDSFKREFGRTPSSLRNP